MAQQNKMYALPQELKQRYFQIFVPSFPLEVRHYCAQWIEDQQWFMPELDPNHPLCDQYASRLVNMLVDQIRNQSEQIRNNGDHMPFAMALQRCAQTVKDDFMSRPMDLVRVIQNHLTTERHILEKAENPMMADQAMESQDTEDESQKVQQTFEILKTRMQEVNNGLDGLQQHQEMCNLQVQQFVRTKAQLEKWTQLVQAQPEYTSKLEQGKQEYTTLYHNVLSQQTRIRSERLEIAVKQSEMLTQLDELQTFVEQELERWKAKQKQKSIGMVVDESLDQTQQWCEQLAYYTWTCRQSILKADGIRKMLSLSQPKTPDSAPDRHPELFDAVHSLLQKLLKITFVVTEQPPQVLKKQTKFAASVRLLIGGKLNFHMQSPKVTVTIVNEKQASQLVQNPQEMRLRQQKSGEILNNMMAMEYHDGTHMFSAHFRNMQLKKITRPVKTSRNEAHAVTEEKFALLFQTSFSIDSDKQLDVFSMSLPVVVIVHGNQEPDASATIMWDNAFALVDCKPFVAPEQVKWCQLTECIGQDFLSKMLKDKGRDMTKPRGLSADDRLYLAEKLYGMEVYNSDLAAVNDLAVTWTRFNKEDLRGKDFTFWQWYYSAAKLLKEDKQLKQMWNSSLLMGFIGKGKAEQILASKPKGTFLARFSESRQGGITIAWIQDVENHMGVYHLAAWTAADFKQRCLADRIRDLASLLYLCQDPNAEPMPKDQALQSYYTIPEPQLKMEPNADGYVVSDLKCHLPDRFDQMHLDDPRSPASVQSSSYEPPSPAISYAGSTSQQPSANFVDVGSGNPLIDNMDLMADFMTDSGAPFSPQVDYVDDLVDMSVFNLVCGQGQDMFLGGAGDPDSTN